MRLLQHIQCPADVQKLPRDQLAVLAQEIRDRIIEVVGRNGGHLTSNLGVVELTIALHRVFDFRQDRLLWDVGHQCYPHKLLTGRQSQFDTLRQAGGVSGFPCPEESAYDLFAVGHAGTAIATAIGLARGDALLGRDSRIVAVVGDASIVNGVSFEALNHAGTLKRQFLVILNDNEWGISPTQGGMAAHLAKFRASQWYEELKARTKQILPKLPLVGKAALEALVHLKEGIKATVSPGQVFEPLGFQYVGPVDGHDLNELIETLRIVQRANHPILLHVYTVKGKGYDWASAEPGRFHSSKPFVVRDGKAIVNEGTGRSWTRAFVENLVELAQEDPRIFALTSGMPDGTGLNEFARRFPDRFLDVGIAESCTVDMAAGMARAGLRPVVAIYSTFLQRGFDQVYQEAALQGLPVLFCMDRAGLVGSDGAVHQGFCDIAYLRGLPGMVLMAPIDEQELREALRLALRLQQPCAIRYPRDKVAPPIPDCTPLVPGQARRLRDGEAATILAYGTTALHALAAAEELAQAGVEVTVVNARFAQPLDRAMVRAAFATGRPVVTVEDHSVVGGFGAGVLETAQELGVLRSVAVARLGMPADRFVEHGTRVQQLAWCGYDTAGIAQTVRRLLATEAAATVVPGRGQRKRRSVVSG
ncbi:MAG TPA: 1-deoxy-D-xylulose-5-phosphate synthase [Phycisphaerae bacterium]|nr:1-deoxy-D-xylulose-5-phosphate synthase [Phycisphaerae bacterium]HNU46953.1 1-deoxy-D-xylulose-5-phosphate synthase [Phycisphaerae bacterium]